MTGDELAQLSVGMDVLVPADVPSPLTGSPAITASDGAYELYWMNPGSPPTFLDITGVVGGDVPDYSKADRNVQLEQNADINGYPAWHDLTDLYDLIYWQVGDVVYSVESRNLEGTDSATIAAGLISLQIDDSSGGSAATLELSCPETAVAGSTVSFFLSGSGVAIVDANAGAFPGNSPNSDFAADQPDDTTLVGDLGDSGEVELAWTAPDVDEAQTIYLFASTEDGVTPGECGITVSPSDLVQAASLDQGNVDSTTEGNNASAPEVTEDAGAAVSDNDDQDSESAQQDDPEPTATKRPRPTRTPKPYNEMEGIPTSPAEANGSPTAPTTPTVRPTATFAPTRLEDGTVASVIGPEGGTLKSPSGITVIIPAGALTSQSTITIQPLADSKIPATNGVEPIKGTAFDITIAGPDGRALEKLEEPAEIRMKLEQDAIDDGARIFEAEGAGLTQVANMRIEDDELVVKMTSFTRIVAGRPVAVTAARQRNVLPFILAGVVVIIVMIVMIVLAGMFRPRRHRIITNRRPTRTRHR